MRVQYFMRVRGMETPHNVPDRVVNVPDGALEGLETDERDAVIRTYVMNDVNETFSFDYRGSPTAPHQG